MVSEHWKQKDHKLFGLYDDSGERIDNFGNNLEEKTINFKVDAVSTVESKLKEIMPEGSRKATIYFGRVA